MNKKELVFEGINRYIATGLQTLTEFQLGYLDDNGIESSIEYGDNDAEVSMEIFNDEPSDDDFYLKIDTKGNILKSYN